MIIEEKERLAKELYDAVLQTANQFLHNCEHFSITVLADENPTYEEVAEVMHQLSKIILVLADDSDPMMYQKASEYCVLMKFLGTAISNRDEAALSKYLAQLKGKPFL